MPGDVFSVPGVDGLYDLAPSEFTQARDELVKRLRESGDRDAANAVKKLRRPTIVAWAINQLARRDGSDIEELLELGGRMREEQAGLLGGGDAATLREIADRRRETVHRLASMAAELAGEPHQSDAAATLDAASLDPDTESLLRSGRLSETLDPPAGFGIAGMPEPAEATPERVDRRVLKRLERQVEKAATAVTAAERRLLSAERQREDAQAAVDRAREELDDARAEQQEARDRLQQLDV